MKLGKMRAPDGSLILVALSPVGEASGAIADLPDGAEPTGVVDKIEDSLAKLRATIKSAVSLGAEVMSEYGPSEWTIEFEIGFSGEFHPIPFIASSEAKGCLKVTATWKKRE